MPFFRFQLLGFLRCRWCDDLEDQNIQDSNPENSEKSRVFQRISWDFFCSQPFFFGSQESKHFGMWTWNGQESCGGRSLLSIGLVEKMGVSPIWSFHLDHEKTHPWFLGWERVVIFVSLTDALVIFSPGEKKSGWLGGFFWIPCWRISGRFQWS